MDLGAHRRETGHSGHNRSVRAILSGVATALLLTAAAALGTGASPAVASESTTAAGAPGFLPVSDVVVPVASHGRLSGYVMIKATIEFESPTVAKGAEPWLPRIVDAWLRTMHGLSEHGHFDAASVDPEMLKRQLLQATKSAGGIGQPRDILIGQALYTQVR